MAAIVVGVAGATSAASAILVAGLAALTGGAVSMALGEYVSVSGQRDLERSVLPSADIDAQRANPWSAAVASAVAFLAGGVLPLLTMTLAPSTTRIPATVLVVLIALGAAGALGAHLGGAPPLRPTVRTILGGALALMLTYLIGGLFNVNGVTS